MTLIIWRLEKILSFLISLLHEPLKQFQKEMNMLLKIFLFMVSTIVADAEARTGGAVKLKKQSLQCKHKRLCPLGRIVRVISPLCSGYRKVYILLNSFVEE